MDFNDVKCELKGLNDLITLLLLNTTNHGSSHHNDGKQDWASSWRARASGTPGAAVAEFAAAIGAVPYNRPAPGVSARWC